MVQLISLGLLINNSPKLDLKVKYKAYHSLNQTTK